MKHVRNILRRKYVDKTTELRRALIMKSQFWEQTQTWSFIVEMCSSVPAALSSHM